MPKFPVRVYDIPASRRERSAVPTGIVKIEAPTFEEVPAAAEAYFTALGREVYRTLPGDPNMPDLNINGIYLIVEED